MHLRLASASENFQQVMLIVLVGTWYDVPLDICLHNPNGCVEIFQRDNHCINWIISKGYLEGLEQIRNVQAIGWELDL